MGGMYMKPCIDCQHDQVYSPSSITTAMPLAVSSALPSTGNSLSSLLVASFVFLFHRHKNKRTFQGKDTPHAALPNRAFDVRITALSE